MTTHNNTHYIVGIYRTAENRDEDLCLDGRIFPNLPDAESWLRRRMPELTPDEPTLLVVLTEATEPKVDTDAWTLLYQTTAHWSSEDGLIYDGPWEVL